MFVNVAKLLLSDYKIPSIFVLLLINTFFCTGKDNRKKIQKKPTHYKEASFAIFLKFLITCIIFIHSYTKKQHCVILKLAGTVPEGSQYVLPN